MRLESGEKPIGKILVVEVVVFKVLAGSTMPLTLVAPALSKVLTRSSSACIRCAISAFSARSCDTSASRFWT